jgi:hypothetical protein
MAKAGLFEVQSVATGPWILLEALFDTAYRGKTLAVYRCDVIGLGILGGK